jgi:hypothetical protein
MVFGKVKGTLIRDAMAKKMTIEDLARLVEERAQGIEEKMATKENIQEVLQSVHHVEELLKGKVDTLDHIHLEQRVEKLEERTEELAGQRK